MIDRTRPHHVGFVKGTFGCMVCGTIGTAVVSGLGTMELALCCDCPADAPAKDWPTVQIGGPIAFNSHHSRAVVSASGYGVRLPVEQKDE